ncbi:MAG: Hsp70 family protein [Pseudonocardia sp.]|nr:Hsp70 family protein [Pseudonocardia sp.]
MGYRLGVDLGTTFVAAARSSGSQIEMLTLGDRSVVMPSAVFVGEDGDTLTGEAADRRAARSPERVARQFKRRLGDPTPLRLGDASYSATDLLAVLLREVLARVKVTEGEAPDKVVLTHPANWGRYRRGIFEDVPRAAGLSDVLTLTEPEAAALHYAATRRLGDGELVAVYDLGGGTFDATVVRKVPEGVATLGTPEGVERLGGIDFDQAVFDFVNHAADGALDELDMGDPKTAIALARLRQDCVLAKESLSVDTETLVPVFLPGRQFDVRITRADFEGLIRAHIESTITALSRALRSAGVTADELNAVLLVGGCSRIPLVTQMVSEELGRPILVDTHPKYAVALGAATPTDQPAAPPPIKRLTWRAGQSGEQRRPGSPRSPLFRRVIAAVLFVAIVALGWTLITLSGIGSAPQVTPQPNAAAPALPRVLAPPRHIAVPKVNKAIVVSSGEPVLAVLNENSLSALDAATLAPRWTVTVPRADILKSFGDESVGVCAGEPRLMTECTPVNLTTGAVEPTFQLPGKVYSIEPVDGGQRLMLVNQDVVVNVMDTQTHAVRSVPLPAGYRGKTMEIAVGGHRAYFVRDYETPAPVLTIVDLDTTAVTTMPWPPEAGPTAGRGWALEGTRDGTALYILIDHGLLRFDSATMRLQYKMPQQVPLAPSVVTTSDGRYLYLVTMEGELRVIDAATGRQVSSGRTGPNPRKIFMLDRGRQVAVQTADGVGVDLFDTSAFAGA